MSGAIGPCISMDRKGPNVSETVWLLCLNNAVNDYKRHEKKFS